MKRCSFLHFRQPCFAFVEMYLRALGYLIFFPFMLTYFYFYPEYYLAMTLLRASCESQSQCPFLTRMRRVDQFQNWYVHVPPQRYADGTRGQSPWRRQRPRLSPALGDIWYLLPPLLYLNGSLIGEGSLTALLKLPWSRSGGSAWPP